MDGTFSWVLYTPIPPLILETFNKNFNLIRFDFINDWIFVQAASTRLLRSGPVMENSSINLTDSIPVSQVSHIYQGIVQFGVRQAPIQHSFTIQSLARMSPTSLTHSKTTAIRITQSKCSDICQSSIFFWQLHRGNSSSFISTIQMVV